VKWQGDLVYKFDKAMSRLVEAQGYTTMLQTGERELIVTYNRYYHTYRYFNKGGGPNGNQPKPDPAGPEVANGCLLKIGDDAKISDPVCSTAFAMRLSFTPA
jgi:hypothetical protein